MRLCQAIKIRSDQQAIRKIRAVASHLWLTDDPQGLLDQLGSSAHRFILYSKAGLSDQCQKLHAVSLHFRSKCPQLHLTLTSRKAKKPPTLLRVWQVLAIVSALAALSVTAAFVCFVVMHKSNLNTWFLSNLSRRATWILLPRGLFILVGLSLRGRIYMVFLRCTNHGPTYSFFHRHRLQTTKYLNLAPPTTYSIKCSN